MKRFLLASATALAMFSLNAFAATFVYVPLGSGNSVVKIDADTDSIVAGYPGVMNAHGLVAGADGEYLYAGSLNEDVARQSEMNSDMFVVHPDHGHVMEKIPVSGMSHHQAITPDGRYILSTHPSRQIVSVVDLEQNRQVRTIDTGTAPYYPLVSPDNRYAYVSNRGDGTVSEIDLSTWQVVRQIPAGPAPSHMVLSVDGKRLFVVSSSNGELSTIDLTGGQPLRSMPLAAGLHGLDLSDDGSWLFVSSQKEGRLFAVSTEDETVRTLDLAPKPYHLNAIRGTGKVYVSSASQPRLWVVEQATLELLGEIELPAGEGHQMAIIRK